MAFRIGGGGGFNPGIGERNDSVGNPPSRGGFDSFKRGGKVKKTGLAKVDKGERVLTKKQQHARSEKKMSKR